MFKYSWCLWDGSGCQKCIQWQGTADSQPRLRERTSLVKFFYKTLRNNRPNKWQVELDCVSPYPVWHFCQNTVAKWKENLCGGQKNSKRHNIYVILISLLLNSSWKHRTSGFDLQCLNKFTLDITMRTWHQRSLLNWGRWGHVPTTLANERWRCAGVFAARC